MLTMRHLITFLSLAYSPEQLLFPHPIARAARKALAQTANLEYKNRGTGKVSLNSLAGRKFSMYESNSAKRNHLFPEIWHSLLKYGIKPATWNESTSREGPKFFEPQTHRNMCTKEMHIECIQ